MKPPYRLPVLCNLVILSAIINGLAEIGYLAFPFSRRADECMTLGTVTSCSDSRVGQGPSGLPELFGESPHSMRIIPTCAAFRMGPDTPPRSSSSSSSELGAGPLPAGAGYSGRSTSELEVRDNDGEAASKQLARMS